MSTVKTKIDLGQVLAFLKKNFDNSIKNIDFIKGGEMSQAFSFYSKENSFVIRINKTSRSFYKDDFAHKHFADENIPIPKIIQIGKFDDAHYFAISQKAEGRHINDLTENEYIKNLPDLVRVLDAIHAKDISKYTGYGKWNIEGNGDYKSWKEFILSAKDYPEKENLFETSILEKNIWDKIYAKIQELAQFCPEERYLVHGDYSHNNVISDGQKVTGVFDWDGSSYGDFVYDIAWMTFWLKQPDRIRATEEIFINRNIPHFKERLLCYKLRIGLTSISFYAYSQQKEKYEYVKRDLLALCPN